MVDEEVDIFVSKAFESPGWAWYLPSLLNSVDDRCSKQDEDVWCNVVEARIAFDR